MNRKFIPCIFIKNGLAVAGLDDLTVIETDPVRLAIQYSLGNPDELIIYDMSQDDEEHEQSLNIIHELCEKVSIPVIGCGNVKRMEDIKKLLYAGCKRAVLNYSINSNILLTKEVSLKFGKDKILAEIADANDYKENYDLLNEFVSGIILLDRDITKDSFFAENNKHKFIVSLPNILLDKLIEYTLMDKVEGITGNVVNNNISELNNLKSLIPDTYPDFSIFKLNSDGLIPVIVQDYKTNQVLMLAYMNEEAYNCTLKNKKMTYYSRSRQCLWIKGDTSGHYQFLKALSYDCDNDTILAKVEQIGAACHTGEYSCFFNHIIENEFEEKNPLSVLTDVYNVISDRRINPKEGSYTNYLFDKGIDKILKKVGEEATEIVIAAKNPNANEIKYEISDFLYHVMVLMVEKNVTWEEIMTELSNR